MAEFDLILLSWSLFGSMPLLDRQVTASANLYMSASVIPLVLVQLGAVIDRFTEPSWILFFVSFRVSLLREIMASTELITNKSSM